MRGPVSFILPIKKRSKMEGRRENEKNLPYTFLWSPRHVEQYTVVFLQPVYMYKIFQYDRENCNCIEGANLEILKLHSMGLLLIANRKHSSMLYTVVLYVSFFIK